ncbi:MAG: TIGR04283 family arsenosugar biosynthesis glycosyltransferase [Thermodesulfovibrionales bacterium]
MKSSFSIIIPVLHESSIINRTIEHIRRIGSGFEFEIIVVDGDKKGGTINFIKHNDVIKIVSPRGRGIQMNKGASAAKGEILLFLHTDTELPEEAFDGISSVISNREYTGGAFDLGIESGRWIFRLIEKLVFVRTRATRIPYGDQAIFIRRECFETLKGFKDIPIMEDVEFMRRLKKSGYKISIIPQKVKTSSRRWEREGILYCTLRNWALISLYSIGVKPEKLVKFYYRDWE